MNAARIRGESEAGAALGVVLITLAVVSAAAWALDLSPAGGGYFPFPTLMVAVIGPAIVMPAVGIWLLLRDRDATRSLVAAYLDSPLLIAASLLAAVLATAVVCSCYSFHTLFDSEHPGARPYPYRGIVRTTAVFVMHWVIAGCLGAFLVVRRRRV